MKDVVMMVVQEEKVEGKLETQKPNNAILTYFDLVASMTIVLTDIVVTIMIMTVTNVLQEIIEAIVKRKL
jgi:hypothetical protein